MLSVFLVKCTYERPINFVEGPGVVVFEAVLKVHAKDEEGIPKLISDWSGKIKVEILAIHPNGTISEGEEVVMKAYDTILSTRLV